MIDTTVRLVGGGYSVTLTDSAEELHRQPGGSGWGMAPVINSWFEGAGDGALLRGTRRAVRELVIPIAAFGGTPRQVEASIRSMVRIIRKPFRVYIDVHATGQSFWIDAVYNSGLEGVYSMTPDQWNDAQIVLHCPDPYWTSEVSQSFVIAPKPADAPFLPELAGLHVASSAAFGEITVSNVGDVESKPTITIHGPGTNPTFLVNGQGFLLQKVLGPTQLVRVEFRNGGWVIEDVDSGNNLYGQLAQDPPPIFPELPPGVSVVTATMTDTGTQSYIRAIYPERREVVY
jgi:hypothetical protein